MALFIDTFVNRIDRKGRVSVPAAYRTALAGQSFSGIVALPAFKYRALTCAGIEPNERTVKGMMEFVRRGVRTSVALSREESERQRSEAA